MSGATAATWSPLVASMFREPNYRFVDGRGLDEIEIAAAPEWLVGLVRKESTD